MLEFGISVKLVRLSIMIMSNLTSSVSIPGEKSIDFEIKDRLRQGLFNIALKKAVRNTPMRDSGTIYNRSVQILSYSGDIDIIALASQFGLVINESKGRTKITIYKTLLRPVVMYGLET